METFGQEIDIDSIVRQRAGRKGRFIPRWLTGALASFIHQDYINGYLRQGYMGIDFCKGTLDYLGVTVSVEGLENLPQDGTLCTFVSNHPLGAIDGVTLGYAIGSRYDGKIKILVNDLLMNLKGLAPLCIPVNKLGRQNRSLSRLMDEAYSSDNHIITFPAGLCSRRGDDGAIRDLEWKPSFVRKSVETGRTVIPVHFIGENSRRFYTVARICKQLGMKVNLAMALLPDEMYRSRGRHYRVVFGRPIMPATFDHSRTAAEWAEWTKQLVYTI